MAQGQLARALIKPQRSCLVRPEVGNLLCLQRISNNYNRHDAASFASSSGDWFCSTALSRHLQINTGIELYAKTLFAWLPSITF
jgi:hypothetical protein